MLVLRRLCASPSSLYAIATVARRTSARNKLLGRSDIIMRYGYLLFFAILIGCETPATMPLQLTPPPAPEIPAANLPTKLRQWNWTDRFGSGSCGHASLVYHLRWQGQLALAQWWRDNHAGGVTATSICNDCTAAGIDFVCTRTADPAFLDWASRTRRGAIIWFFDAHCVHFCGFAKIDGREYALLCDNNRVDQFIRIERTEFLQRWKGYDGFALSTVFPPAPPNLYPIFKQSTPMESDENL